MMKSIQTLIKLTKNFDMESVHGLNVKLVRDFSEVYVDLRDKMKAHRPHCSPNDLIGLYNDIIDHLINVVTDKELEQISWPIPELKNLVLDEEIPSYWND